MQKLLRLDWGRPLGSQPLPRSLTLLLVPPRAWWCDLNTIDIVLWFQDIASRQTDVVEGRAGGDPYQGRSLEIRERLLFAALGLPRYTFRPSQNSPL
ncbi:hypothetical protein AAFF_G00324200 [Aldrovandia affinis]|uniref:Uncharacterized protein n=1 Tax=Aldrovandia affinis TaxID=143900 RepID=A0AAD7W084_9TELE|nr:hypothetical protein AAFF_G00324200 [Aldrovandia affinis]